MLTIDTNVAAYDDDDFEGNPTELADCLTYLCHRAKREFPRVGRESSPTEWDKRHQAINDKLTKWQAASCPR